MRVVEENMIAAVKARKSKSFGNTVVEYDGRTNISSVYLHGNRIAMVDWDNHGVKVSSCGWYTVTTKSRLNALLWGLGMHEQIRQKNWEWFVGDKNFMNGMIFKF